MWVAQAHLEHWQGLEQSQDVSHAGVWSKNILVRVGRQGPCGRSGRGWNNSCLITLQGYCKASSMTTYVILTWTVSRA